ncbi:MAG: YbaK/EbsC family protein [Oscillospiraceae bacterium]|nr:YbaK/EbsC family protein [Oscillospiraceae bacterium]
MSIEKARAHLRKYGLEDRIMEFDVSSATVELAAGAVGVEPGKIAKTLSFMLSEGPVLILFAGDVRTDNKKFKDVFSQKAKMLSHDEVEALIGHGVGGVCPFGINEGVNVYLDASLRRFDTVYPAAGTSASAVRLSIEELEKCSESKGWVDVSKLPEEKEA